MQNKKFPNKKQHGVVFCSEFIIMIKLGFYCYKGVTMKLNVAFSNQDQTESIDQVEFKRRLFVSPHYRTRSGLISRNITVNGNRTTIRLEEHMWDALKEIAYREKQTIHTLCSLIYNQKTEETSFTASIRVFLMLYFRLASTEDGHRRAGHGSF
jgi:predicted DNA-binding ribbon-helix-helix protein